MLLRNTEATRAFFKKVRKLSENHKAMNKVRLTIPKPCSKTPA